MQEYWEGKGIKINASILDYSSSFFMYEDKNDLLASDTMFNEMIHETFDSEKYTNKTH